MTEIDASLVRRKLAAIVRNLSDLEEIKGLDLEEYRRDRFRLKGTERLVQETIEAAVDLNLHILRATGATSPADYFESFVQVGRCGVIPNHLAESLAPCAGLRNRIVHEYDEVDDAIVLEAVSEALALFPLYVEAIEARLKKEGL